MKHFDDVTSIRGALSAFQAESRHDAGSGRQIRVIGLAEDNNTYTWCVFLDVTGQRHTIYHLKSFYGRDAAIAFAKKRAMLMLNAAIRHKRWLVKRQLKRQAAYERRQQADPAWGAF